MLVYSARNLDCSPVSFSPHANTSSVTSDLWSSRTLLEHSPHCIVSMLLDPSPTSLSQENTEHHPAHDGEIKWQMTMKALTPLTGTPGQKHSIIASPWS